MIKWHVLTRSYTLLPNSVKVPNTKLEKIKIKVRKLVTQLLNSVRCGDFLLSKYIHRIVLFIIFIIKIPQSVAKCYS